MYKFVRDINGRWANTKSKGTVCHYCLSGQSCLSSFHVIILFMLNHMYGIASIICYTKTECSLTPLRLGYWELKSLLLLLSSSHLIQQISMMDSIYNNGVFYVTYVLCLAHCHKVLTHYIHAWLCPICILYITKHSCLQHFTCGIQQ